ncbi:MAG: 16S rRNA (guanine(966)-N(2))-methyltransferase RsmD [Candidatus Hydrogenedentes bacterium]|nr:16S rRNA (guanine(966)-N(2))-methyltransferase RsmD [Candidatus Hydrogenedentota bacterium]
MRVIAGTARGIRLEKPKGLHVRPTLDRARESLFNILAPRLPSARFLDLFAGTGANGIEALSRGAAKAVFVDNSPQALQVIARNLIATQLSQKAVVKWLHLPRELSRVEEDGLPYHIVFADPPYRFSDYEELVVRLESLQLIAEDGLLVIEHAARRALPDRLGRLACQRTSTFGEACLSFFLTP